MTKCDTHDAAQIQVCINGWNIQQLNEWEVRLRDPDGNTWRIRDGGGGDFGEFIFKFAKALLSNGAVK